MYTASLYAQELLNIAHQIPRSLLLQHYYWNTSSSRASTAEWILLNTTRGHK